MPSTPQFKGYAFALLATVAGSTVYIFSKAALEQVSLAQFGVYWFAMGFIWNFLFSIRTAKHRHFYRVTNKTFRVLLLLGIIEIVATGSFYAAISVSANPAVPSFLRNMEYIFVTLMGVFLLGERFSRIEILGVVLTFSGAFVISYQKGASIGDYLTGCSGLMLISTIFYGFRTITAKKHIMEVTPTVLSISRTVFLFLFAAAMLLIFKQGIAIPVRALIMIILGSFLGPFLTSLSQYNALIYLNASRSAILQSTTALFVLLGAYLYFGRFPLEYQIVGGFLTIIGPLLLIVGKKLQLTKRS